MDKLRVEGKSDVCPTKVKIRKEKRVEQHQDKKGTVINIRNIARNKMWEYG